jgi:Uncharacterized Zn-finger containing protein
MSEHEKTEIDENDLAKVTGGSKGFHFGIEKPKFIVFECKTCRGLKKVPTVDYIVINSAPIAGGLCCGKYREIKYHCPQCGSVFVDYGNGTIYCSSCQKATRSDGSVTAY